MPRPVGRSPIARAHLRLDADREEALELLPGRPEHPEGRVARAGQRRGGLDELLEDRLERQLGRERDSRLDERLRAVLCNLHRPGQYPRDPAWRTAAKRRCLPASPRRSWDREPENAHRRLCRGRARPGRRPRDRARADVGRHVEAGDDRDRGRPDRDAPGRDRAARHGARLAVGAGDARRVRRSAVPVLRRVGGAGAPRHRHELRADGQGAGALQRHDVRRGRLGDGLQDGPRGRPSRGGSGTC